MKRIQYKAIGMVAFFALMTVIVSSTTCFAARLGDFLYEERGEYIEITGYVGTSSTVTIPHSINGKKVISIGPNAFSGNTYTNEVVLPNGIESIGNHAFSGSTLCNITIPNSVMTIGEYSFSECENLTSVIVPDSVTSLGAGSFYRCSSLSSAKLPSGLTVINSSMFYSCIALRDISIPSSVETISSQAFTGCMSLQKLLLPADLKVIDRFAFSLCNSLSSITLPSGLQSLGSYAFECCSNLSSAFFNGPPPSFGTYIFENAKSGFCVYYHITKEASWKTVTNYVTRPFCRLKLVLGYDNKTQILPAPIYGGYIIRPQPPMRTGYKFIDWYKDSIFSEVLDFTTTIVTDDIVLYAKWTANTYTVTFNSQGGSAVASKTTNFNTTITAPTPPTRTGYTFGGWYRQAACTTAWNFATDKVTANTILYAKWTINTYTVTFNSQGGSTVASKTANYNTTITAPIAPTRISHTFGGWYKQAACTTAWNFATDKITANTILYAKWTPIAAPASPKATAASYNSVKLTWSAVSGAGGYEVWRSTSSGSGFMLVGSVSGTSYTNSLVATGTTYYYKIRAYCSVGGTRVYGPYSAVVFTRTVPAVPTWPKATAASYNSVKVTWSAAGGAGGYEVWRSTAAASGYKLAAMVAGTSSTSTGLSTGTTYYYKIRAYRTVNGSKVYGGYSSVVSARTVPATPAGAKATVVSYNSARVSWSAAGGAGGYEVWRSTAAASGYKLAATVNGTSSTSTGLATGTTYYYKIRAYRTVNGVKVYGLYSAVVSAKPVLSAATGLKAARVSATSIRLTWYAVAGVTKYEVYRAASASGTYTKLTEVTSAAYTGTGLTTGKTYYYKVRAYRLVAGKKVYGGYSAVVSAKP